MSSNSIISLVIFVSLTFLTQSLNAEAAEKYAMNGKIVPKSMYDAALLLKHGFQQIKANQNQEAIETLKQAEVLAPDFADIHHHLGIALAKTGRSKEAIEQLEKAKDLNPGSSTVWLYLGGLYQTDGQISKALETYKTYLSKFPQDSSAQRVKSLVEGLSKETDRLGSDEATAGYRSNVQSDDYLQEVTRQGVVRWRLDRMPLIVFIEDGKDTAGCRPELKDLLKRSFLDWQKASGDLVSFSFTDKKEESNIQCSWTDDPRTLSNIAELGETHVFSSSKGLYKGTIKFLTEPLVKEIPMTTNRMRFIFLHEIGHVLGIPGHTTCPTDAMFHSMPMKDEWRDLTLRDKNTIHRLYSPAITNLKGKGQES